MAILTSPKRAPVRSVSLPSRLNSNVIQIEEELNKLKTWENPLVFADSVSAETITNGLVGLSKLYNYLEELVQSPFSKQTLTQHQNGKIISEALEASIGLLDSCTIARDLSLMLKDNVRNIQSVLRRKGGALSIESGINAFMRSTQKVKRESTKCLKAMKQMENISVSTKQGNINPYLAMLIRVLREVSLVTISVFRFVFLFLSVQATKRKSSRWSLISNLILKSSSKTNGQFLNQVKRIDVDIQKVNVKLNVETTRRSLEALDHDIEGLEKGLDCLFRLLLKNRVSLLNMLVEE